VLGAAIFAADYGALFWAEKEVPSGLAAVIAATIPVWVLLTELAVTRSGPPNAKALAGIVLGITGVILLTIPAGLHNSRFSISALVLFCGCFVWAAGTVASRQLDLPRHISMSAGLQMCFGGGLLLVISAFAGELGRLPMVLHQWTWRLTFAMAYLILFASIFAFSAYVWLIARDPATRVASYAYVNPVVALLLGLLIAHERATPLQYLGAVLVLGGVASTIAGKRPVARHSAQKVS
jgi:drug/metabolite transporter (DMT)-like permease